MIELLLRFHSKIELGDNGCHEWTAGKDFYGYGSFSINKKHIKAHRFSYQLYKGMIPEGLVIDHLCRNKSCVNPTHLEAVTHRENCIRGNVGKNNQFAGKTHCKRGHEFNNTNTYIKPDGYRECMKCRKFRDDRSKQ